MAGPILTVDRTPERVRHVGGDEAVLEPTAAVLERFGMALRVDQESSPVRALDTLAITGYDCCIWDDDLPEMNGIELLLTVRERDPELPIILSTG